MNTRDVLLGFNESSEWWTSPVAVSRASAQRRVNSACSRTGSISGVAFGLRHPPADIELTDGEVRELTEAASRIDISGDRYNDQVQWMIDR